MTMRHQVTTEAAMKGARQAPQFNFRIPPEVKDWLEKQAASNNRSTAGELLTILQRAMRTEQPQGTAQ